MKKIFIATIFLFLLLGGIIVAKNNAQIVDIYVCSQGLLSAELEAKAKVSRKEIYVVGYCQCQGVDNDLVKEVRNYKNECDLSKHMVYSCMCVGKSNY